MEIEIKTNSEYKEPKISILTNNINDPAISNIIKILKDYFSYSLKGYLDDQLYVLEQANIESIYTENKKVYARQDGISYEIKNRLYELEELLNKDFVRISNSEIINFKKVKKFDFKITGTILVYFVSGNISYVSRRYIKRIKEYLEL